MASAAEAILAPLRQAAERTGTSDFLRWWTGELAAAVPQAWRERLSSRGVAYVSVEGDEWRALRLSSGQLVETGRANLATPDATFRRAALRRLIEEAAGGSSNVWLVLPDDAVLVRPASLPLAAEEALRDAVGFELDRLTPFAQENALFDHRVKGRDATAQRLDLEIAAVARAPVQARLAELREMGATVLGVGVAGDLAGASAPFNLLAPEARERPATSRAALAARALAAFAVVFAAAALIYPLWQKREAVIGLQPRLDSAKAGADVADRLAKEIEKLAAEHNFLLAKKQAQYPAVVLLEDLSRLLPDTTWVQQLDIRSGPKIRELQISGETGSSSQLIEVLEKSGPLANASFKSPLTKGVTPGTERFLVAAEVKARPLPEPMPEARLRPAQAEAPPAAAAPVVLPPAGTPGAPVGAVPPVLANPAPAVPAAAPAVPPPAAPAAPAKMTPAPPGPVPATGATPAAVPVPAPPPTSTPGAAPAKVTPAPPAPAPATGATPAAAPVPAPPPTSTPGAAPAKPVAVAPKAAEPPAPAKPAAKG